MGNNPTNGVDPDGGCWITNDDGTTSPCPDGNIGDTMVGNQGATWTYGKNGWDTDAFDANEVFIGTLMTVKDPRYLGQTRFWAGANNTMGEIPDMKAEAHERLVKSNQVLMMGVQTVLGMAGEAQTLTNNLRNKSFNPSIVPSVSSRVKVGQWMTKAEYETFMQTGIIPRGNVLSKGAQGFNDPKLTHYVEFRVHPNILKTKDVNRGWEAVLPNNGPWVRLNKMKGNPIPEARGYDMVLRLVRTKN